MSIRACARKQIQGVGLVRRAETWEGGQGVGERTHPAPLQPPPPLLPTTLCPPPPRPFLPLLPLPLLLSPLLHVQPLPHAPPPSSLLAPSPHRLQRARARAGRCVQTYRGHAPLACLSDTTAASRTLASALAAAEKEAEEAVASWPSETAVVEAPARTSLSE